MSRYTNLGARPKEVSAEPYLGEFAFRHGRRKTNGVGRIAARVIEQLVVREPLPWHKLVNETRRCRWFGSAQAQAARGKRIGMMPSCSRF